MGNVASLLQQERKRKGLALQEVEKQTLIPLRYLELLEGKEEKHLLADPLYLVPLLRTYADFLGMNSARITADFTMEMQEGQAQHGRIAKAKRGPEILASPPQRSRTFSLTVVLVVVLVTLAIIGQFSNTGPRQPENEGPRLLPIPSSSDPFLALAPQSSSPPPSSSSSVPPSTPPTERATEPISSSPQIGSSSREIAARAQSAEMSPSQVEAARGNLPPQQHLRQGEGSHVLRVQAKESTWIRLTVAGQSPKDVLLQPGQAVEWASATEFLLTLGNAGGVELILDGRNLPPLGKSGQVVRNIRLPVQG